MRRNKMIKVEKTKVRTKGSDTDIGIDFLVFMKWMRMVYPEEYYSALKIMCEYEEREHGIAADEDDEEDDDEYFD